MKHETFEAFCEANSVNPSELSEAQNITSYEDACKALNRDPKALPDVSMMPVKHQKSVLSYCMLITVIEALNNGWEPNWNNREVKYNAWFEIEGTDENPAGVGFSAAGYGYWHTGSNCGSRLCFKSRALALYAGWRFEDLFKEYFLIG